MSPRTVLTIRTRPETRQRLEALARAIGNQTAEQQLADAYKLKRMLDSQVKNLDRAAQPGNKVPDKDLKDTAGDARETVKQLKHLTEQQPTKQAFAQPLRDALSSTNQANLEEKLSNLERTGSSGQISEGGDREQKAAEARDALGKVSQAFAASQPKSLQMAQSSDSVNPDPKDALGQGMAELDSLIKQLEKRRALSTEDQARQGGQALYDLQTGMRNMHGDNSSGNQILLQLQQMLKEGAPLDVENLKKLLEQLQHFSVETSEKRTAKDEKAELTNIDPSFI